MSGNNGNGTKPPAKKEPEVDPVGEVSGFKLADKPEAQKEEVIDPRLIDPHGTHRQEPVLPGFEGLPFKGRIPNLKETDRVQPQIAAQVYVHVLNLSNDEDMKLYQKICQVVGNGMGQISFEKHEYDKDIKSWRVFIRWMLNYAHMPSESGSLFM